MFTFVVVICLVKSAVASPPYRENAGSFSESHLAPYNFPDGAHDYSYGFLPVGTAVTEVTKSSAVLQIREPSAVSSAYVKEVSPYTATTSKDAPPVASSSTDIPHASAAYALPYAIYPYGTTDSAFVKDISADFAKIPPTISNQGVEYAPAANKPYDPVVHLNEPAKIISPKYHALSGVISTVGQVSVVDRNDPQKHGYGPRY